jgi:threonine/homoserine/homoserine lactone efflux protein
MIFDYFWKGVIVGLSASIPLGPVGVLCIQRTLNKGRISGFFSGLGAASADVFYATIAGFGVSFIIDYLIEYQTFLRIIGSIVLFLLGYRLWYSNPGIELRKQLKRKRKGLFGDFLSTFALTISNPITIFVFAAVFASFSIVDTRANLWAVIILILGILFGASLYWFSLSSIVNIFRDKFRLRRLLYINRIASIFVIIFGIVIILSILL